ncbi:MAG: hypothetical protein JXA89_06885 [Anaerolineae bacterium]|nr:hypothetical protein [Anaerolineae bacterium]
MRAAMCILWRDQVKDLLNVGADGWTTKAYAAETEAGAFSHALGTIAIAGGAMEPLIEGQDLIWVLIDL